MSLPSILLSSGPPTEIVTNPNPNNKEFATITCTFKATITPGGTWTPDATKIIPTFIPSTKMQVEGKIIAMQQITWTIIGCTQPGGYTHTGGASVSPMLPTTTKCMIEAKGVMRKGDKQNCTGTFTHPSNSPIICTCEIEIDNAGQTKLLGA